MQLVGEIVVEGVDKLKVLATIPENTCEQDEVDTLGDIAKNSKVHESNEAIVLAKGTEDGGLEEKQTVTLKVLQQIQAQKLDFVVGEERSIGV